MEKKTIGKFISALRRANGMTQKELGEKLFVSDKTVSRWERDECTPELSLIPVIAEIFGITTDELLRGERNNPDTASLNAEEVAGKQKAKSDKQFRVMLYNRQKKYKNLTLISVYISILGLIATIIANIAFTSALVGFGIATVCIVASEICQLCFMANARLMLDEEDDSYHAQISEANTKVARTAVKVTVCNIVLWAFCLPLALVEPYFGLEIGVWLPLGLTVVLIALVVCYLAYILFVRELLVKKGVCTFSDELISCFSKERKLLGKLLLAGGAVALVVAIFASALDPLLFAKKYVFDDPYEFKQSVERELGVWLLPEYVEVIGVDHGYISTEDVEICRVKDADGNIVEVNYSWFILSVLDGQNRRIEDESGVLELEMPVKVCFRADKENAQGWINRTAVLLSVIDLAVCTLIYVVKRRRIYNAK